MHVETNLETEKPPTFADAAAASADVDANRVETLRTETHILERPMTDEERLAKGDELADVHATIAKIEADIEAKSAHHKAEKKVLDGQLEEQLAHAKFLANAIKSRTIETDVPCRVEKVFATGVIRTVRIDTGAVIEERAMEGDERQADLLADVAPESFSNLADDSEPAPPQDITIEGEIVELGWNHVPMWHLDLELRGHGTRIHVQLVEPVDIDTCHDDCDVGDRLELVGHYGGEGGEEIATFIASQLRVLDETDIDASKMATIGDAHEAKTNGKGRRK